MRAIDGDEVAELLVTGERGGVGGDALLRVAVAGSGDDVDEVVERARALRGIRVEQPTLVPRGVGEARGGGEALSERTGRDLDAVGVAVCGVARGLRAPGAQCLQVVELEAVPAQVELDLLRERAGPVGQHETVAANPVAVGRSRRMNFRTRRYAAGARLMAVPGCPFPTRSTASAARKRAVSVALLSMEFHCNAATRCTRP